MKNLIFLGTFLASAAALAVPTTPQPLNFQTGDLPILSGAATIHTGNTLRYLDAAGAKRVIVDLWGNPPQAAEDVLGLILPVGGELEDDASWGVVVTEARDGHVSDSDAAKTDYAGLMRDMQQGTREHNKARVAAGFGEVELIGWADTPRYDAVTHKMYWAKELAFKENASDTEATGHTLNYAVRVLGRDNVLELNAVAGMTELPQVQRGMQGILQQVSFNPGHRYEDFDASTDKLAQYGVAALVGGVVAKKLGFLAVALVFLKKGWILVVGVLGVLSRRLKRGAQ
ncbi:DUF2167 domain-containing protein [Deinococcus oregonensis]|uniref:DUF2167 domain-containing protein n=1 Tax=Deinococcus oregonensis TaxID=1805970 RepID=A0ABV6B7D8_9DEIO